MDIYKKIFLEKTTKKFQKNLHEHLQSVKIDTKTDYNESAQDTEHTRLRHFSHIDFRYHQKSEGGNNFNIQDLNCNQETRCDDLLNRWMANAQEDFTYRRPQYSA